MCSEHEHAIHEVTGAEERFQALQDRVEALEAHIRAEQAVGQAVADGHTTIRAITAALRRRADELQANWRQRSIAAALRESADEIEREAGLK